MSHGISVGRPNAAIERLGLSNGSGAPDPWERIGEAWSAIEPADPTYRIDPALVRAIRELDSDFIPLWLTTEHRSPSGAVVRCVHHAIAWRLRTPHKRHQERRILWPTSRSAINYGYGGFPIYVEEILQGPSGVQGPAFKPISWEDYERIKYGLWWQRNAMPVDPEEEARQAIARSIEAEEKEEKRILDEVNYRFDHESKGVGRHLDQIGTADIQAWGAPREQSKPFVEVHR